MFVVHDVMLVGVLYLDVVVFVIHNSVNVLVLLLEALIIMPEAPFEWFVHHEQLHVVGV